MPTVTGLIPKENLRDGRTPGLRDRNGNTTIVQVTGTGFAVAMDVLVIYGNINPLPEQNVQWTGKLRNENGVWKTTLTCQNPYAGEGAGNPEDLTVTVGTSPVYNPPVGTIPIGPGP